MFFKKYKKPIVKVVKSWSECNEDFYAPGALLEVKKGKGILREVYGETEKCTYSTLMFGKQPLLQLQGDEYYCPTCEKMMKSGYGLEQSSDFNIEKLNEGKDKVSFSEVLESIKPLLGLLSSNYYIIVDTHLYPTDGNGHLFWETPNEDRYLPGTCVYHYKDKDCIWGNLRPYFTVATQPIRKLSKERVEYYRHNYKGRAVALYIDGYMTAVLDGHHKTMAAAIEHRMVDALVIMPCYLTKRMQEDLTYKEYIGFDNMQFDCDEYRMKLKKGISGEKIDETQMKEIILSIPKAPISDLLFYNTSDLVKYYPDVDDVAYIDFVGEITEERLDKILSRETAYMEEEACDLMKVLSALKHQRIMEMANFFLYQNLSGPAIFSIIQSLTKLPRTEELESYLIDQMVELELEHPQIKTLVLEYL